MEFIDEEYTEMANNHEVGLITSCLLNICYCNYGQTIVSTIIYNSIILLYVYMYTHVYVG